MKSIIFFILSFFLFACNETPVNTTGDYIPVNSVYVEFNNGNDTTIECNKIIYDILRGQKITFFKDTTTTTILINEIKYFKYE